MEIPLASRIALYIIVALFGFLCTALFQWQVQVLRGKRKKNPDGTFDDWHEQKLFYGIALADIAIAIPVTLVGMVLALTGWRIGYYLTGLGSFWFLWANVVSTATSLRFEKPKITLSWCIVFPFGALIGLAYIVWSLLHFDAIFLP